MVRRDNAIYFRDLAPSTVEDHLSAIIAARSSGQPLALTLKSRGDDLWTFINAETVLGLANLVDQLPPERDLNWHESTIDGQLVVVFSFRKAHPSIRPKPAKMLRCRPLSMLSPILHLKCGRR